MKINWQHVYHVGRMAEFHWPSSVAGFLVYLCTGSGDELNALQWHDMAYLPHEHVRILARCGLIVRLVIHGDLDEVNQKIAVNWVKQGNRSRRHPVLTKQTPMTGSADATQFWNGIEYPKREIIGRAVSPSEVRRAMRMELAPGKHSIQEWRQVMQRDGWKCLRCGSTKRLTKDHIVPIAKGGSNDASNLQTLCLSCNASKGAKHIDYRASVAQLGEARG